MTSAGMLSESILSATAAQTGTDETELPALYEFVDMDAVRSLVDHRDVREDATTRIEFSYAGCRVVVDGGGSVAVRRDDERASTIADSTSADSTDDGANSPVSE